MKKNKPTFKLWEVLLIAFVASLIMGLSTGYVVYMESKERNIHIKANDKNIETFLNVYNAILNDYYGEKIDKEGLIDAAIKGMVTYLDDPYTTYLNEDSKEYLLDSLNGTYEGIGVEIRQEDDNSIVIITVFDKSPAAEAGLKAGDIIKTINGQSLKEKSATDAVNIIRENQDGNVKIEVQRIDQILTFELKRSTLNVPVIYSEIFENNNKKIGYISLSKFSATVGEQFKSNLLKLEESKIDSLIIDVRDNTGGYLNGATHISELFLKKDAVIYSLKDKLSTKAYKDLTDEQRNYKVGVLINNNSASASEVLAGALKYSYGATLIGEKSFGKGKVQQTSDLGDGSMIKYTSAKWLMPNGECIDNVGIKPDIEVILSDEFMKNKTKENDNQLQSAIFELSK